MKRSLAIVFAILSIFLFNLKAATITSTPSGGNWSVGGTWVGGNIPSGGDSVVIAGGATITVDGNDSCLAVYFAAGTSNNLIISGTNILTVLSGITFSVPSSTHNQSLDIGSGRVLCNYLTMGSPGTNRITRVTITTGHFTATGNISMPGNVARNLFTCSDAAVITIGGTWTGTGGITEDDATFVFNGASSQAIWAATYQKLILSGSGTKTLSGIITCTDSLIIEAGTLLDNSGSGAITTNGVFYVEGTYTETSTSGNAIVFNGNVRITPTGEIRFTVTEALTIAGATTIDGVFNSAGAVTVNALVTNNDTFVVAGNLTGSGEIINATSSSYLEINGSTISISTLTVSALGNTVAFGRTGGSQVIPSLTYQNLLIKGANTKNLGSDLTVNEDLKIESGSTLNVSTSHYDITLYGNFINDGVFVPRNATSIFTMAGTSQTIGGSADPIPFNILTINNGSVTSLSQNINFDDNLNVNGGGVLNLNTFSANKLVAGGTLTVAGELVLGGTTGGQTGSNFPLNFTTFTSSGGTITYNRSAGGQTVFATTYFNLTSGNTSGSNTAGGNLTVNGVLTTTSGGTLNMSTNELLGSLTSIINGGTIQISSTANPPIPDGKTWGGTVNYAAGAGAQTIAGATSYNNLTMSNTSVANTLGGAVTVNGVFTMSGGKLILGSNTLTLNGTISGMTGSSSLTANGLSNILIGGSGSLGTDLFLDQTIAGTTNRVNNLTYNRASGTITLGDTLEVSGTITPTAGTLATANKLKLISGVSGTARVASGSGSYITGNVTVQRFVPASARRWRFCGAAVSGRTMTDIKDNIYITGAGGAVNGFDATLSNQAGIYSYNEADITGNFNSGWIACGHITDPITVGKGYRIFVRGDRSDLGRLDGSVTTQNAVTVDLTGNLNAGDISLPVTFTPSGTLPNDGWNLVANPYASQIDWNAFHDAGRTGVDSNFSGTDYAHIKQTVYIFDGATNSYTSYNALSNSGTGSLSSGIIPAGAAFWVQAVASSPSLTMKEIYKTASTPAAVFKTVSDQLTIKLIMDSITSDEAAIKFMPEAVSGFDAYDIGKLYGSDVNIASIGTDGSFLSANCKPFIGYSDTIPLSLGFAHSGQYKMEFDNLEGLGLDADKTIYLVDRLNHNVNNLKTKSEYVFTINIEDTLTFGNSRFMLVVGDNPSTVLPEFEERIGKETLYLYPTITRGNLVVHNNAVNQENVDVRITDLCGKTFVILPQLKWTNEELILNLSEYPSGLYFISIIENNRLLQTFKCIKE